jgi:hypothetical protein
MLTLSSSVRLGARQLQCRVLGRQGIGRQPSVDAPRVGRKRCARARQKRGQRTLRRAPQADRAQLHVACQCVRSQQFRERAARKAPVLVHLEKAVARVHPALHEIQVVFVRGEDVRDAVAIDDQLACYCVDGLIRSALQIAADRFEDSPYHAPSPSRPRIVAYLVGQACSTVGRGDSYIHRGH